MQPGPNGNQVQLGLLGKELRREALKADPDFQKVDPLVDPDFPASEQMYFPETGHNLRFRFLDYWKQNGGQEQFGLPISEEHLEFEPVSGGYYLTQWFERARFEYHPEKQPPNDVLLGLLGRQLLDYNSNFNFTWKIGRRASYLTDPNSIFVDGKGNVYVNDRADGRINKYNSQFKLVNYWYTGGTSQAIAGIARANPSNDTPVLYQIGTSQSTKVNKLMPNGQWQTIELADAGDSDSLAPNLGLAVDESENIYILKYASSSNYLVWKYNSKGLFLQKLVKRSDVTDPTAFFVSKGKIYIANGTAGNYKVFNADTTQSNAASGDTFSLGTDSTKLKGALAITLDSEGNVFVGEAGQIDTFDRNGTAGLPFGTPGRGGGQIFNPAGLATDKEGNLYIADPANHQVSIFDQTGNFKTNLQDRPYNLDGSLVAAGGVAVNSTSPGSILVSDPVNKRIQKFDTTGNFLQKWSASGISLLAVAPDNANFYGLDSVNGLVIKFDADGKELAKWDGSVTGKGKFNLPGGLAVGPDGSVYVADTGNQRIVKLDAKGGLLTAWGAKGAGDGQFGGTGFNNVFDGPTSLAVEPGTGNLYVVDPALYRVQKFNPQGKLLGIITNLANNRAFEPVAVAAAPPQNTPGSDSTATTPTPAATAPANGTPGEGIYILTRDTLYRLDRDGKVATSITANVLLEGMSGGDTGDGGIGNLTSLAADNSGNLYATDKFGRLVKFRTR